MDIKNEKELIEFIYDMNLQNLSGREDFADAFREGINATIEELKELKLLDLHLVVVSFCPNCNSKDIRPIVGNTTYECRDCCHTWAI